jgi:predicted nucleic acid-binding Zn ribbon protein
VTTQLFCTGCGKPLGAGVRFCSSCGQALDRERLPANTTPSRSQRSGISFKLKIALLGVVAIIVAAIVFSSSPNKQSADSGQNAPALHRPPFSANNDLVIDASAARTEDGRVVISGTTNLPDGLKMWINVEEGKLPLGAPKSIASDESVYVHDGKFSTQSLWMEVPNTQFTKRGWPKGVLVDIRQRPFLPKPYKVHFLSYFNGAWQSKDVINAVGGEGAKPLKGKIVKAENPDVTDITLPLSPFLSSTQKQKRFRWYAKRS